MPADALAVFIKFRDFLVTLAPWIILALIAGVGMTETLRGRAAGGPRGRRSLLVGAGLAFAMPSILGTLGFGLWLALVRAAFVATVLVAGSNIATASERSVVVQRWLGAAGPQLPEAGLKDQAKRLWKAAMERLDDVGLWLLGACVAAGVIAIFVPYQTGFDLFGRTVWVGAVLGAVIGTLTRRGTGMELPLASLLLLKGGANAAAAALLLASTPLPFRLWRDGARGWIAGLLGGGLQCRRGRPGRFGVLINSSAGLAL